MPDHHVFPGILSPSSWRVTNPGYVVATGACVSPCTKESAQGNSSSVAPQPALEFRPAGVDPLDELAARWNRHRQVRQPDPSDGDGLRESKRPLLAVLPSCRRLAECVLQNPSAMMQAWLEACPAPARAVHAHRGCRGGR